MRTWRRIHWLDESRFLLHVTDGRMRVWRQKNMVYTPRNIQPTVPYAGGSVIIWGCISHDCKLDLGHHTRKNNRWSVRDVLQPVVVSHFDNHAPTSSKTCVYGWQCQAASFKGSNHLPSKWSRDVPSMASHELEFESDKACLRHARPSCTGSCTSCTKLTLIGSSIASGIAAATTAAHLMTDWRDETEGCSNHASMWWFHSILNFEPWMSLSN